MTLLGKLFGKRQKAGSAVSLVEELLNQVISLGKFELSFEIQTESDGSIVVDIFGKDEEMLVSKDGQLLDALQLYVRRAVQHQLPEETAIINIDCANYRKEANEALIALAEKLKGIALSKGKSVYFRALPPKDRKVIHQYLAEDGRVKSRSVGDGHFKKIKIFPARNGSDLMGEPEGRDEVFETR